VITIHQRYRQTDRQTDRRTDRQTTCDRNTALCTKVHRAVIISRRLMLIYPQSIWIDLNKFLWQPLKLPLCLSETVVNRSDADAWRTLMTLIMWCGRKCLCACGRTGLRPKWSWPKRSVTETYGTRSGELPAGRLPINWSRDSSCKQMMGAVVLRVVFRLCLYRYRSLLHFATQTPLMGIICLHVRHLCLRQVNEVNGGDNVVIGLSQRTGQSDSWGVKRA